MLNYGVVRVHWSVDNAGSDGLKRMWWQLQSRPSQTNPYALHAGSTNWLRFSFVGGKRKKSRKVRSPACRT